MKTVPDYIKTVRPTRKYPTRPMHVHGYGVLMQADLAVMPADGAHTYFLLVIDIFSRKLFCCPLARKDAKSVKEAFLTIFAEAKVIPEKLETDRGTEFIGNKAFFREKGIYFRVKTGRHKAAFAEHGIYLVKRRLYRLLRTLGKDKWVEYLGQVVKNLNLTPNNAIGGVKPSEINSPVDDVKIDAAAKPWQPPPVAKLRSNDEKYKANVKNLQVGDHVYADFESKLFDKSFDLQRGQMFQISRILASEEPPIFYLADLKGAAVPGTFYKQQLHKVAAPKPDEIWKIGDVLKTEKRKGKKWHFVSYLGYPKKFNEWIPAHHMVDL